MKNSYFKKLIGALCLTLVLGTTIGVNHCTSMTKDGNKIAREQMEKLGDYFAMEDPPAMDWKW